MAKNKRKESDQRTILGFTLSKRGWNNVLIYIVLILMFIFYFLGHENQRLGSGDSFQPFANDTLVEVTDGQYTLTRVGNRWQQQQGPELSADVLERWREHWQYLRLEPTASLLQGREYRVELTFADQEHAVEVGVFFFDGQALVALPGADHVFRVVSSNPEYLRPLP